jgi:hypothetical protein
MISIKIMEAQTANNKSQKSVFFSFLLRTRNQFISNNKHKQGQIVFFSFATR